MCVALVLEGLNYEIHLLVHRFVPKYVSHASFPLLSQLLVVEQFAPKLAEGSKKFKKMEYIFM